MHNPSPVVVVVVMIINALPPHTLQKIHEPQIKREVGRLLEALSGIVKKTFEEDEVNAATSNVNFAVELFDKLLPIIQECPKLLG